MLDTDTKRRIDTARNILVGKIPDPKSQVEQITIALIYKFMDDMDAESEELGGKRTFFIGDFARYGWAKLLRSILSGHETPALYAEAISRIPENPGLPELFRDIFKNAFLPYRDPETLKTFLKIIDEFTYDHSEKLGDAFEYLLSVLGSQGDAGQLRTPRHIIDFMVEIVDPKKDEKVLDPACGTAGFLVSAYKYIKLQNSSEAQRKKAETLKVQKTAEDRINTSSLNGASGDLLTPDDRATLARNLQGYDISPDMVRLSLVNLYLHGFDDPHIYEYDTLTSEERWNEFADVILANPPFMSPKGGIKPHQRFSIQSKRSEVLFVDYMADHLTSGGRAAIIVPEGIIFQIRNAYKDLRRKLMDECLVAVVSLPAGCFNPYSDLKTSILIFDKSLAKHSPTLGFFKVENDGFGLGTQRRPIDKNDLPQAKRELQAYLEALRAREGTNEMELRHGLVVDKARVTKGGDCNLSGERYREVKRCESSFPWISVSEVIETVAPPKKIPKTDYRDKGKYPIIDQSQEEIAGWTDDERALVHPENPLVVFGDHTCSVKLLNYPFAQGADGIKILKSGEQLSPLYLYHTLRKKPLPSEGYKRHFIALKRYQMPLPPLAVQKEIVAEIEGYQKVIDGARAVLDHYRPHIPIHPDWPMVELGDVCDLYQPKTVSKKDLLEDGEYPVFGANGIIGHYNQYNHEASEVLVTCRGATCGTINMSVPKSWVTGNAMVATPKGKDITKPFLFALLAGSDLTSTISGSAQCQITRQGLAPYQIPLPPLETQQAIVAEIEGEQALVQTNHELIESMEKKIEAALARIWGEVLKAVV